MSIPGLYPSSGNHAIQSAVFAAEWTEPLMVADVMRLRAAAEPLKAEFPAMQDQQMVVFNMTQGSKSSQQSELGGFVLSKNNTLLGGSGRAILVNRESIQVHVSDYTRWEKVKDEVQRYFKLLLPVTSRPVNELGLQYQDVFLWRSDPQSMPLREIFRNDSKFLPSHVFDLKDLWHSHHGYFEEFATPCVHRRLDNVNVARILNQSGHALQLVTSHRATFKEPLWDDRPAIFSSILDSMHAKNKEILKQILSDPVQEMIQLNKREVSNV